MNDKNPTLLQLLKLGCKVEFPSRYSMTGDPDNNYIDLRTEEGGSDGLETLNEEGVERSLVYEEKYRIEKLEEQDHN